MTTQSLDRKLLMRSPNDTDRSAVLCNKHALDVLENELRRWQASAANKNERKPLKLIREINKTKYFACYDTSHHVYKLLVN